MAVISIIENCQNLVKLKLPEPDPDNQIDFYIFEALSVLPKLEYLWIKVDGNIDIEAEEILIAILPHLIINPEWIQTPAIKGGLNSECTYFHFGPILKQMCQLTIIICFSFKPMGVFTPLNC
jgi:hypothetical protein